MQTTLLKIRLIQLKRLVSELGIFYTLFFLMLLAGLLLVINRQFQERTGAFIVLGCLTGFFWMVQQNRSDLAFILKHLPYPRRQLFTEYLVFSLLFILPAFFSPNWYLVLLLVPAVGLIVHFRTEIRQKTRLPQLSQIIGAQNFEWISGIRQAFPFLALLLVLALATSWLKFVPLVLLWLLTTILVSFYQHCEPLHMLQAPGKTARQVLRTKLVNYGRLLLAFTLPVLLINSVFHPELAWVSGLFLVLQFTLLAFGIFLKYSTYSPNANLSGNSLLLSIAAIGVIIPFMLPLPLFMSIRNYGRAIRNLNHYLHDQPA